MPFPIVPLLFVGGGIIAGAVLGGDRSDAQVIVNTSDPNKVLTFSKSALLVGAAVGAIVIAPKVLEQS